MLSEDQMIKKIQRMRTKESSDWCQKISQNLLVNCDVDDNRPFLQFNCLVNVEGKVYFILNSL